MSMSPPTGERPNQDEGGGEPYEPFRQYYEGGTVAPAPAPARRSGLLGWLISGGLAVLGLFKYAVILVKLVPGLPTMITLLVSFALYAAFFGGWATAAGLVLMILVHEMGHVLEIRRQGLHASAPIFIPFMGAAIFQRSMPSDPVRQAQIGIAGPLLGTAGAVVAFVLYASTRNQVFLYWAWIGFYINLFNLIPVGMLDGGWILSPVSRWFQVAGLAVLVGLTLLSHFSPFMILIAILAIPMVWRRFTDPAAEAYFTRGPAGPRYAMGGAWLVLVLFLAFASYQAHGLLNSAIG